MSGMSTINGNYGLQATDFLPNGGMTANGSNSGATEVMEEIIAMLSHALAQLQQGGQGGGTSSGGTPTTGTTGTTGGTGGTGGATTMNPQSASGALAGYMGTNGNDSLNMNDLYKLAQGQAAGGNGQTPSPAVQQAAQYMMSNPGVFNQIETHDVAGADGKSGIANFQNAAQGDFPISAPGSTSTTGSSGTSPSLPTATTPSTSTTPATTPTSTGASTQPAMNEQTAAGALAGYMGTNGNGSLDVNDLYKLSQGQAIGGNGQKPSTQVQQAAQYMLANPSVFNKIETNDVAGADGKSGIGNFQNAAQGLV
ncbi:MULTISPECIES: hypothetical protein [Paraburkholderia]|uniref:hypothetical protein n=1 Tax=Paraburkholderia TaxID=1822464 RepID=UPI0003A0E833|nr:MULTISPECIES: hypothetical protein [Paraburkholderia]MDH6146190.1 hypothetical protein [Paraburkholderia sp. WSM4179]